MKPITTRHIDEWDKAATYLAVHGDVVINRNIHLRAAMALESLITGYSQMKKALEGMEKESTR